MKIHHLLKQTAASLLLIASGVGSAQAGLITGSADPAFGVALPGVSYRVDFSLLLPDSFLIGAQSIPNPTVDLTGADVHVTGQVSLYETADRTNFVSANYDFRLGAITFDFANSGVLVGWGLFNPGERLSLPALAGFDLAGFNDFDVTWSSLDTAPEVRCTTCIGGPIPASLANSVVNYVDRFDGGASKLGQDAEGRDLGVEYKYDELGVRGDTQFNAVYVNQPLVARNVPEPSTVGLVLIALFGSVWVSRRRTS